MPGETRDFSVFRALVESYVPGCPLRPSLGLLDCPSFEFRNDSSDTYNKILSTVVWERDDKKPERYPAMRLLVALRRSLNRRKPGPDSFIPASIPAMVRAIHAKERHPDAEYCYKREHAEGLSGDLVFDEFAFAKKREATE